MSSDKAATDDNLRPNYRFDYRKAKVNRFAAETVKEDDLSDNELRASFAVNVLRGFFWPLFQS